MASKKSLNKQTNQDTKDYNSFKVVLFYCLLIVIFPIVTFFCVKNFICDNFLNLEPVRANISAALSAVIALHVALGIYIYRAYFAAEAVAASSPETIKKQD